MDYRFIEPRGWSEPPEPSQERIERAQLQAREDFDIWLESEEATEVDEDGAFECIAKILESYGLDPLDDPSDKFLMEWIEYYGDVKSEKA